MAADYLKSIFPKPKSIFLQWTMLTQRLSIIPEKLSLCTRSNIRSNNELKIHLTPEITVKKEININN